MTRWPVLMALGFVVGAAVGLGAVEADMAIYQVEGGTNNYPGPSVTNYYTTLEYTSQYQGDYPSHRYRQRWSLQADQDYPEATEAELRYGVYRYASGGSSGKACFWKTKIFDEDGNNVEFSDAWTRVTLTSSMYAYRSLDWEYDEFEGGDKNLNVRQIMVVPYVANTLCSSGMSGSPSMFHESVWEVY